MFFHPRVPNNPSQQLRSLRASRYYNTTVTLLFLVISIVTAVDSSSVVPCPTGTSVSVTMATHFQGSSAIFFQQCDFVHEVFLANTLSNVNISFVGCVFHKGNGSIRFDPSGTFTNVVVEVSNSTVVHWWLIMSSSGGLAVIEDTSPVSDSLFIVGGATSGLPYLSGVSVLVSRLLWTAACVNRSSNLYGTNAIGLPSYFTAGAWRSVGSQGFTGEMQHWAPSLWYATGTATVVTLTIVLSGVQTIALVGSVAAEVSAITSGSSQASLNVAIDACAGLPIVAHVHLVAFELSTTLIASSVTIQSSVLQFGNPGYAASGVLPGASASLIRVQPLGSTPSDNLVRNAAFSVSSTNVTIAVVPAPRVSLVGNVDIPDGVTPRWRRNVTVGGASLAATVLPAPIVPSPLVSTVGGVKLIGSIDGYSRTALASNTVSIAVTNSFFRAGPALSTMDSVSISAGWLNNSIVAQGVDVVSSWIHLSRLPQLVAATIFMTNATMEATGVDRSWMELAASAMNTTATHPFYQNVWNDADVIMRASSSQIGVASAAGWAFSVFAHTVVIAEFGSGGLMHSSITISGSQCRCSDRCHAVNITGGISMLGHRKVGRESADVLASRTDSKLTNVTIAFDAFTFRSRVASKAVTLSTYCATFLRLSDKTSPTAACASVSHRLIHFAEELLLDTIYSIRLTIDASVVSIFEPMTSTAERSTVLTNAALQAFMFPPQGTAYQRQGVWPALLQITAYRMYNFYFRLGSCSVDAGWGHDVTLMFQQNVDPSRSGALVESTTLTLLNTTITHRGWQTRAVAWMSPSTSNTVLNLTTSRISHLSVTAASSARTVVVQGSTSGASKDAQGLQVLWTSTTVAQTITPLQIASTMLNITNMSGIVSAVTFATAAVYYANLSFGDGGILMTSSTVTVAAVDPTTTLRGWAVDGSLAVIITSNATFLSTSNFASEDGVTLTLVQAPTSMEMMSIGVFADSVLLSDGAPFSLTRTTIKGISMGAVFTRTTFSNAQFFVSSVSTIAAACEVYPDRAIGVASSIWSNSNKTGDSFWTQCAATMFVANTSFLSGSAIWLDSSTLSTTILLASSTVATSCYVVPAALDSIVVHGTWVTSQIVIRRSSVVVDGRGSLSSPRPTGIIIVSSSSAIRTWRLVSGNTTTLVGGNATLWNTTTITISTSSTIAIDSSFGPAVCLQLLYATVYRSSFQVNTASTITVTSTSRLPSKTGTVTHYTTGSALCPNVVSGFANSSYLDAQLDSIRRVVLSSSNATATRNGAAYLYCGRRCVVAQLENRFDSSFLTVITALDPPVPALDMGWLVPSTTTPANNISVPIPMVNFLVQRRRAALVHFGTGGSVISGDPDDNVTIAFGVSVLFMKSTVITMCEVQPVAAYGRLYDITTDVGDVLNPLQCRSVGVLLEQPTQLFAFELRVDGSTMRSTVQSSVITTSVARNTLADPDSQAALQRAQILLQTAQIMNMTSAEAYGCRHLVNGVAIMSAAWMYMPAKALIRWHAFNASASAKPEDFFSDSVAATFIWGTGVVVLQRPVNASVLWSAMPILSLSDANAVVSAWSYVAETQPLNITITSQSTVVASSSTIAEGCSAANIHFQGSTAIDGLFVNVSGSSVLRAALYIIPVLRVNATANALTSAEESSCVAVAQSSANANNDRSYNNAFTSLSALEKEEPVAVNLLFHNVTLTSTTISILDTTITAFVSPVFTISTELTMAGAWFYESRFPRLTGAAAVNGSYMMHRALSRHACNIRFDGTYKTSSWNSFEVNRGPSSAAQLSMTARIFSGIDGKAQNIVFSGLGSWRDASNLWSFASLAALPLTAVGSPRTFPVMKEALLLGVPLASMLSGNVLIDRTFNTSNQTLSIGGAALTCGGHCTNIALGSTISSATTTLSPWLGTRISITGTSFLSQALLSEFQPPLSGVNSNSGVILTISSGVFSAANRVTVYLSIGRLAQTRQRVSHNVILGTVGPESQVAIQGASFVSSGVNVGIINAALSTVQISITSLSGFWSGCWAGSQSVDSSGTSYVALGRDVASSRPCLPTVSTCPTSSGPQSINSTTPDSTLEPSVGNLLICKSNITRSSVVQLRVPQASPTFTAAVVIPSNWSNSDSTLIAAKNVLVVDSYLGQSSSLTISPVTPSTTTLQLIANVSMPRVSSPNSTVFATSLWWSSATNIEFVNVTVDNARVAFSASTMLIRSYAAVSADGILMTVATSHNIRLVRSTWSCGGTTTSCIQLPSSTSRSDVVQAATSTLVTRNVLFGSLYQVGFSLNGIQELSSFSSAVNNSISLNVIVEDNTWSTAMFYASSALAPTAVVSSPSAFMSATVQGMNAFSKAANVAVTGSTAFVNTSVVMLQGFGDVSASYFPFESNTSSLWTTLLPLSGIYIPFAIVPLCTSVEIASVLFPTVNMFVSQNTTISNARFEYSNTLMTTNSSNMQCMSSNIANMTVSLYQSTWSASITPADASPQQLQGANVWNVALAANSGDIGTINFIVEQSSKLIAVSVGGGNAFNIAVDVTISGLNSEACLSPIVPLTLSVTDWSGLSAISSQNATASNLWVNACMNLSTATAAFKPSSSVITLNVLRNSYVQSNAAGGGALSSSSSSQMNGISSIDASSALNVFVRGNVSSQLFTVNVTVSDSSRATATGGAVAQVILIRSSHTNQKALLTVQQASSVAATSTRYAGVVEQHYLQQSNNTMYANVMINTSITVSTSSSIRCTVTNTITDEAGASIPRPYWRAAGLLDRMQWPALLHEDNSAVRVLQQYSDVLSSSTSISSLVNVLVTGDSAVMSTLTVSDTRLADRGGLLAGYSIFSKSTTTATLTNIVRQWRSGVSHSAVANVSVTSSNGARIHVNNSIAAASSSTQRRNDTSSLPSTCALAARNKLAADLLARSVRYSTSVIDVLDVIPATSLTPTLAARQTSATVSIDSSSTVASMTSMIFPTYNQSASMVTIAAAVDVSLVRAPYTAFSPSGNLTSVGMPQVPLGTQPPVIVATIDDIQVNVHVSRGSLLTIVVSSGAPQEPSSGVLPIGCSRPVFSVGRASVWRRVVSIAPGALVYANTSDLVFATTVAAASYVSATAPNSCAVTAWALPQWWFQSGNISSLRCSLNVSGGGIRLGESKVPSSVCAIAPLIIAAFAVDGSDRFANVSVPLTPVSQSATQSSAQQHRALNVLSIGGPIYTTGVARNKSMISVSLSNQASLIISQESTMTPPNSNTLPSSHSAVVSMTDVPESGSVVLNAEGQSVVTLTHPVSLGASTSNDLIIRLPPLALLSFKSVGSTISNITLTASDQSLLQGSGEISGISLQGSSRCNIVNVVVQVSNRSRVSGAWSSLFSMDIDDIDTLVSVQRAQNISVSVDNAPYAGTFTMGVLMIPKAQANINQFFVNISQSTFVASPFVAQEVALLNARSLLSYAAPVTTVFPSALQMWSDNISVIGFQSLLSPEFASVVGAAVTPATSAAIVIAGGSWSPDPTVVAGDWPSLFVGLPLSLQQRIVTFFSTRLWNGQMIVPHGYIASTRSSSNELSVTDSSTVTITDTSVFTMSATNSYSQSISQPQSKSGTLSPSIGSATLSHTKPSSTLTTTPPLRLCPTIEAITIPFDMMDVDIASPLARNVLLVRFAASSNNFENGSFTWSLDLWKYVDFELVVTSPFRGETRGFDAVLSAPLRNASRANGWIPQDDTFQVMALELPTAVNYQLIGDEVIRILFSRDAVAGGCSPNGAQSVAPVPSFLTVMSADFTIHADMSMSLQAASAVVTVLGGTAGVFLAVFGDATTFVSVFDVQLLALLGQMKCALPDQIRFAEYAVYILSPFGGISPQWMALGGAILVLSVAIAHYLFVFIACFLRRDLPTLMHGKAFVRFPGISFALSSLLLAGILSGAFQSTDGTDGKAATSVGQALAGILFGIVFMAYLGNLLFREVPLMIDYRAYPQQDDPLLMKLMSSRSVNWWMPSGVWMARIAPYTAHRAFTAVVGAYNKTSLVTALMMHIHVILMSIVSGYHFADDACVIQYSILLVVQLCFTVFYAVRPPLRVRFLNLILAISNISIVAALAANIAYASNPQPHLSNVQSGLQLLVAAVSLVKVTSLCVIFVLEYRLSPPPLGPPAAPEKKRIPIAHEKSVDFSSSDDDDDSSVDTLGIRRTRPINAAALDDSFSSLASSARSIEEGKHRSSSPTSSPTHQQLPQRSLVNQIHQATIAMEGHNTHTEVSIANKNSTSFDSNDDDDDDDL